MVKGRSCRESSRRDPSDSEPFAFLNIELLAAGMNKIELPLGILPVEPAVTIHGALAVGAALKDREAVKLAVAVVRRVRFQRLDDQPLVRITGSYF